MKIRERTQNDIVLNSLAGSEIGTEIVEKVKFPNVESLHLRPREEIAEMLVTILKSRTGITRINWELGQPFIEISYIRKN